MKFKEWLVMREMMGSVGSMVSCNDLKNKDFQAQGAVSNLKCGRRKKKEKMKKNNQTNLKDAIVDLAKGIGNVFKKYSRATRKKAWERLTSREGEKEVDKILLDPNRQINTFQKLANKNESFEEWVKRRKS